MYDENGLETELVNCDNCGSTVSENLISSVEILIMGCQEDLLL